MCGIAGVWTGAADSRRRHDVVASMLDSMTGRGPDGTRMVEKHGFTVGFSLLAIVGPAHNRAQPVTEGTLVAGLNGEIYNYKDLARQYGLDSEHLESDALVLPGAYREGKFPNQMDGMFAGFVFDEKEQHLLLFRDHVGIKPMYFARLDGAVVFGSTLTAVAAAAGRREVDSTALESFLRRGYPPSDTPLIVGVEVVPAGTTVSFDSPNSLGTIRQWFTPESDREAEISPFSLSRLRKSVLEEVPDRMPVSVALSGGIDSTSVALILQSAGHLPMTLSVAYDTDDQPTKEDETVVARLVADCALLHQDVRIDRASVVDEVEGEWRFDVPIADPNAIPLSRLARATAEIGSRVMFTGDGADEIFAGYRYHVSAARSFPRGYLQARLGGRMEEPLDRRFAQRLTGCRQMRQLAPGGRDPLLAVRLDDLGAWLEPNLLTKADRFGMAESVEVRVPFLRPGVVKSAFATDASKLVTNGIGKQALRNAVKPLIPGYVLERRKVGFSAPLDGWLRSPETWDLARQTGEDLSHLFEGSVVLELWREHLSGERTQGQQLWRLAVLRSWLEALAKARRAVTPLTVA